MIPSAICIRHTRNLRDWLSAGRFIATALFRAIGRQQTQGEAKKKNHFIAFTSNINVNQVINRSTCLRVASELILIEFLWQKICKVRKNKTYQLISTLLVAQAEDHWIECAARTIIICFAYRLNMPHDDDKRCEKFRGNATHKQNIMSRMLDHNTHPWSWSNCSRFHATEFIEWVFSSST